MSPASYLLALMLLSCAMRARASERPSGCPSVSVLQGLPDRVVGAGTAFLLLLTPKAFRGPIRRYQVSLADDMSSLPTWLVYSAQTSTLQGLALREESGEYTLRVTAVGQCHADTSTASSHFHLRVLRETSTGAEATPPRPVLRTEISRSNLGCPVGEATTMADLVLHADVVSLDGVERLRLVTTMADYLHLPHSSITLLSFRDTLSMRQENTTILASGHTAFLAQGANGEGLDRGWLKAEVLWTVGCGDFEMLADLVQVLQHSTDSGHLSVLLGVPVRGWRVLRRGTAARARKRRQLCPTPTPTLVITPPNQVPESALRPPLAGLVTTTWQVPMLTQAPGTVAASKSKPTHIDLQNTVEGHEAEFSSAFEETLRHTVDPLFVVSPVLLPDIMGPNGEFSTTSHHSLSSLHTTEYLAKDPKISTTAPSDVIRRTWSVNALLDSSQSVTVFSLTSPVIAESSKRIASITLFSILPTYSIVYSSSIMHLQTPNRYHTTQLYPEESMHTSRNLPQGLFSTKTFDSLVVPRTEDSYTKGPNNILMSKADMEPHTPTTPEQTTTTNFIKPLETSMQKSEFSQLLSKSRLILLPASSMTAEEKLTWSTHNIPRKETSVPWVFNGLTTKVFSTHVKILLILDVESKTSPPSSTAALRSLITQSLLTREGHPQQSTPTVSAEKAMDPYSIFPTVLMHSPSDSSITLLSSLTAGPPFMHSLSDMTTSVTTSLAGSSGKDPSVRLSLDVQQTVLESLKHTLSSRSALFLTPSSQSQLTGFKTGTPQIGQQTSVTSHSPLETFMRSPSWFDLQVSLTSSPQFRLETFLTISPQVQLQSPMTSQLELDNFKMTTPSGLGSTFASFSTSKTVFLQFEHNTLSSLSAATPNLVTGSTRQAATAPAWSDNNITETTLLSTLHHRPVASSLMTGNMLTESAAATISEQSSRETPLLDYFSTITLSQTSSKGDPNSSSPAYTFFIAPTTPRTEWINSLLPLSSVTISMQVTSLRNMTGASFLKPPQCTTAHPLSATAPQSSREWLISDSVIFQTEPTALPSRADLFDLEPHSSDAPLKMNSSTEGTCMSRLTSQMFHSTTPPSPQHDTPDLCPTGSTGDTQPPWPSYSGKALATMGSSKGSSLGKAQQTLEPSLTETSSLTTSIFTPYHLFTRSHFSLSATPQNLLPTAKINTEDIIPSTAEWSYSLTSHSQSLDPSYPFSISAVTRNILEIEESGLTSPLAWFSLVETLGEYIRSYPSESLSLLSDISHGMAVQPYSEGSLTAAVTMGEPVTPASTLLSALHVPSPTSEPSLLQSPHDLLTFDLTPTTTTEANAQTTLSTLPSSLLTSLRIEHRSSPEPLLSASHDERSTAGFPPSPVQHSSVGNGFIASPAELQPSSAVFNRSESGSVVPLPPLPVLPFTQAMTRLNIPATVHQHNAQYTSQFSSMTLWPTETLPPGHFGSTSIPARTRGITIFVESSMKQSITQQALSSTTSIGPSNHPPIVLQSIPALEATVGFPFHFFIPSRTFLDPEDGKANQLTLEISPLDGSPSGPASWVALDQKLQLLHGVPLDSDLQFSPQQLLLLARDSAGLTAQLPLVIELRHAPQEPCHTYVLTTRNSLYSFLRERRQIEWFLEKLARFFNDSSASNLALLSLGAGSTIVAWYNFTLCQPGGRAEGWCPEHQIRSMWVGMRTEDRRVDPAFSQAMLPEFPITEVGELTFGGACLLRTPTAEHPTPATTVLTPQSDLHPWTARLLIALLIICGLFLLAVLLIAILRSYRRCGTLSLRPSEVYPTHPLERWALKPRLPPLFQEEVPPPPLQLWLNLTPLPQEEPFTMAPTHTNHQHTRVQQRSVPAQPPSRYQLPPPYSPSIDNYADKPHKTPESKYRL